MLMFEKNSENSLDKCMKRAVLNGIRQMMRILENDDRKKLTYKQLSQWLMC
jgi:hypothetical protein